MYNITNGQMHYAFLHHRELPKQNERSCEEADLPRVAIFLPLSESWPEAYQ